VKLDPYDTASQVRAWLASHRRNQPVTHEVVHDALLALPLMVPDSQLPALTAMMIDHLTGAGPIAPLLRDPTVTDVLVNGPDSVWIDRGAGLERMDVTFPSQEMVRTCAVRLAAQAGRVLDDAHPWVDAHLPGGRRLHAVVPPISMTGTVLSIRSFLSTPLTLDDLVMRSSVSDDIAVILRGLIANRRSLLVTGGTGSGKTTFVNSLIGECASCDRIVIVEDTHELRPRHDHVVSLQSRPPGAGQVVTLTDLVRQSLRMRPDRIVVGEVRGAEIVDLLLALNTGHTGSFATLHANKVAEVASRIEVLAAGSAIGSEAALRAFGAGMDAVVHLGREPHRHVNEIGIVTKIGDHHAVIPVWTYAVGFMPDGEAALRALAT
jgi:pilus assembly protein CpaF